MKFNRYIFDLYLQSVDGRKGIKIWTEFLDWQKWSNLDYKILVKQINSSLTIEQGTEDLRESLKEIKRGLFEPIFIKDKNLGQQGETPNWKDYQTKIERKFGFTTDKEIIEDAKLFWEDELKEIILNDGKDRDQIRNIWISSIYLSILNPHFFFPYFFVSQFYLVGNLFKEFSLILPELPKVRDYKARLDYYFELCEVLYYFRKEVEIKPAEFCTFLYGFAGNFIKEKLEENEKPLRVWITGGGKGDFDSIVDENDNLHHWSGNRETNKSDLQLIYFRAPYSGIGAVSTCLSNGYYDPFDYYENRVITSKIKTFQFITLRELKENEIWKNNFLVKMNMQGVKGEIISHQEYQELRNLLVQKGESPYILPELEGIAMEIDVDLQNERDVEEKLLEPLLEKLGFKESDWVRQLSVRMGRGERNYPDYALLVDNRRKHEETANFLWEAKYRIRNQKELRDSFLQAKSYAQRLQSKAFGIVSVEGIWVINSKDGFQFEKLTRLSWNDLKNSEQLKILKKHFRRPQ